MVDTTHKVNIDVFTNIDKSVRDFKKLEKGISELNAVGLKVNKAGNRFYDTQKKQNIGFEAGTKKIYDYRKKLSETNKEVDRGSKSFKELNKNISTISITLPLLFGSQQLSKGMESLIDPALELLGVTDLYNTFLALKYLPTAEEQLENVLEVGDAWLSESESQRKAEGDTVLMIKHMADAVSYAAQLATTFAAIGKALPEIDLTPFGVGIRISGEEAGAAIGATMGFSLALGALGDKAGNVTSTILGMEAAVGIGMTDAVGKFSNSVKDAVDESGNLDFGKLSADLAEKSIFDVKSAIEGLPSIKDILINVKVNWGGLGGLLGGGMSVGGIGGVLGTLTQVVATKVVDNVGKTGNMLGIDSKIASNIGISPPSILSGLGFGIGNTIGMVGKLLGFEDGGVVPGPTGQATPIIAHGGETITPVGKSSSGFSLSIVNTFNVSDKTELERMIERKNKEMVEDFKRRVSTGY